MRGTRYGAAVVAVAASVAACGAVPRAAGAQSILVETLPRENSTVPRSPFDMAAPDMRAAARLAGCYAVTLGPWSNPQARADTLPVPSRLDLLSDPHARIYIGFRLIARAPGFSAQREAFPPAWGPIGEDSLQLRAWADGRSSVMLFLRRQSDKALRGTARYFSEARVVDSTTGRWMWETYPTATASLRPVQCEPSGGERP